MGASCVVHWRGDVVKREPKAPLCHFAAPEAGRMGACMPHMAFSIDAWVVLPDHMHAMWTLPAADHDYSRRWGHSKAGFVRRSGLPHRSRSGAGACIWQPRFWEHVIRDERDWQAHMDYLHYNPVKHGWVERVADWRHSSFHRCVQRGWHEADWGSTEPSGPDSDCGE